jgi:hypothetical protein
MAVDLLTLVPSPRTRSVNFFNGRLLAGEDLTAEQQTNRAAHGLLGRAVGDGVVAGLEVEASARSNTVLSPTLKVTAGLAINRRGASLVLDADTEVALVRPADATAAGGSAVIFQDCTPPTAGAYVAGAGVYLLTIGPASAPQGLAEVSGLSTSQSPCNSKYNAEGVQFRLIPIDLKPDELADTDRMRNRVAYDCFGVAEQAIFVTNPVGTQASLSSYGLIDRLRSGQLLTDCEVPLAVLYWTATGGLVFVDMWAVRRRPTPGAVTSTWPLVTGFRRRSEAEAMFLQFEDQVQSILLNETGSLGKISADSRFAFLPAAGVLPLTGKNTPAGFDPQVFFGPHASKDVATTDGDLVRDLFEDALTHEPIELARAGKIQLYLIWENLKAMETDDTMQGVLIFASAALRYRGIARFGKKEFSARTAKWSLSRFAPRVI